MQAAFPIRVVILTGAPPSPGSDLVRVGWRVFLEQQPGICVVAEAAGEVESLQMCAQVALLDVSFSGWDGLGIARQVQRRCPSIHTIVLVGRLERLLVENYLQAGVTGILLRSVSGEELVQAVQRAFTGQLTLVNEAVQLLVQPAAREFYPSRRLNLCELEILAQMARGLSSPEIAACLGVSCSTVVQRIRAIFLKLGASNRTEAVSIAILRHLIG